MNGDYVISKRDALRKYRHPHELLWDEVAELSMPRKISSGTQLDGALPPMINSSELHDSTLRTASLMLANGFCSLVTPREEAWQNLTPPKPLRENDQVVKFYREC